LFLTAVEHHGVFLAFVDFFFGRYSFSGWELAKVSHPWGIEKIVDTAESVEIPRE